MSTGDESAAGHGPCVICGEPGVQSFFASRPFITREMHRPDGTTKVVNETLPAVHVCLAHFAEVFSERLPVGYCDNPRCRRWGPMGEASPCGAPYIELWPEEDADPNKNP